MIISTETILAPLKNASTYKEESYSNFKSVFEDVRSTQDKALANLGEPETEAEKLNKSQIQRGFAIHNALLVEAYRNPTPQLMFALNIAAQNLDGAYAMADQSSTE